MRASKQSEVTLDEIMSGIDEKGFAGFIFSLKAERKKIKEIKIILAALILKKGFDKEKVAVDCGRLLKEVFNPEGNEKRTRVAGDVEFFLHFFLVENWKFLLEDGNVKAFFEKILEEEKEEWL